MIVENLQSLGPFLLWLLVSLGYTGLFTAVYLWFTPPDELSLIRTGNSAAALCVAGAVLGYVLPLASAMVHGTGLVDFAIWAFIAMLVQLAAYLALRVCWRGLTGAIIANQLSVAIIVALVSLTVGILNAAAMFE